MYRRSFLYRIIFSFFLALLPMLLLSAYSYLLIRRDLASDRDREYLSTVESIGATVARDAQDVRSVVHLVAQNRSVADSLYALREDDSDDPQIRFVRLYRDVVDWMNANSHATNWFLFFPEREVVLASSGIYDAGSYFRHYSIYDQLDYEDWRAMRPPSGTIEVLGATRIVTSTAGGGSTIRREVSFVSSLRNSPGNRVLLTIGVDQGYFAEIMRPYRLLPGASLAVLDADGRPISATDRTVAADEALLSRVASLAANAVSASAVTRTEEYVVYTHVLGFPDWIVVSLIPEHEYFGDDAAFARSLVAINLVVVAVAIAIALVVSKKIYDPIRMFIRILGETDDAPHIGNEISFIQDHVQFLATARRDLQRKLGSLGPIALERIIDNLLRDESATPASTLDYREIAGFLQDESIRFGRDCYLVAVYVLRGASSDESEAAMELIRTVVRRVFPATVFNPLGRDRFYSVSNFQDEDKRAVFISALQEVHGLLIQHAPSSTLQVSVGGVVRQVSGLRESYHRAAGRLDYVPAQGRIVMREDDHDERSLYYPAGFDAKLENLLLAGDEEGVRDLVQSVAEENRRRGVLTDAGAKKLEAMFLASLESICHRHGVEPEAGQDESSPEASTDRPEGKVLALVSAVARELSAGLQSRREQLERYVSDHFAEEDLYVQRAADDLGYNPSYFSRMFKEQVGRPFSEYLSEYRMERAMSLLVGTDHSVEQIGALVGIPHKATFGRNFKRHTGISPGTFRVVHRER